MSGRIAAGLALAATIGTASPPPGAGAAGAPPTAASDTTVIDFEAFPDGTPACERCPVREQFADAGVRFAFRSPYAATGAATLFGSGAYDPEGEEENHSVSAAWTEEGFVPGLLVMSFPGRPRRVSFRLRGSDVVRRFSVQAVDPAGDPILPSALSRDGVGTYRAARGGLFREVRVTVLHPAGISRVELDGRGPPGHILLVDDLSLGDARVEGPSPASPATGGGATGGGATGGRAGSASSSGAPRRRSAAPPGHAP